MATYYDGLNYTFKLFEDDPPASSAQLILLHLLHENNRHGNTGTVKISDRELGHRTRLSKQTITEAKRTLKNRGLIDFHTDRDKPKTSTVYTLPFFKLGQNVGQDIGHEVGQTLGQKVGREGFVSYTRVGGESRPKTEEFQSINQQQRARENLKEYEIKGNEDAHTLKGRENPDLAAKANVTETAEQSPTRVHESFNATKNDSDDLDEVLEHWRKNLGAGLKFEEQSQFKAWLDRHGKDWMLDMIDRAKAKCYSGGMSMDYINGFMRIEEENLTRPQRKNTKGERTIGRTEKRQSGTVSRNYDAPTANVPWD